MICDRPAALPRSLVGSHASTQDAFLEGVPNPYWPEWFWSWGDSRKRILFLVDCQALAGLFCGEMTLKDESFRRPCVRIMQSVKELWGSGWWPKRDTDCFVQWAPRRHNGPADHLANVAMDEKSRFQWQEESLRQKALDSRIAVTSDGGFRGRGAAASASAFIVWKLSIATRHAEPIAFSYQYWQQGRSAFEAEIIALDTAIRFVCERCI